MYREKFLPLHISVQLPGGKNTGIAVSSDKVGVWVLQLLPVQHSISHFSKDHSLRALRAPPIAAQAVFLSEKEKSIQNDME